MVFGFSFLDNLRINLIKVINSKLLLTNKGVCNNLGGGKFNCSCPTGNNNNNNVFFKNFFRS